ncbi:cell division protein ZapE [soil metagenome]
MGISDTYDEAVRGGALKPDAAQAFVVKKLARLEAELERPGPALLTRLFHGRKQSLKGLYIQGDVGRGKTMLMDIFFAAVKVERKRRVHFHAFMQDVHARLHAARRHRRLRDALAPVSRNLAAEAGLLCLDEMQVSDIADAMILGRLFEGLFGLGVVIVTTSNILPADLYKDGLNRQLFQPFITMLGERLELVSLDGGSDYRLGRVRGQETYITPLSARTDAKIQSLWEKLTDTAKGSSTTIDVLGHEVMVPQSAHGVARFTFADLCEAPLGAADYLAIARNFSTVFVEHIPVLTPQMRNPAKRFILLIDTLYDAGTRLVASASLSPPLLYPEGPHAPEFARTASRLQEMLSSSWWTNKIVET